MNCAPFDHLHLEAPPPLQKLSRTLLPPPRQGAVQVLWGRAAPMPSIDKVYLSIYIHV